MTHARHVAAADPQPTSTEIKMLDGIFVKSMVIHNVGDIVPQHAHSYAHVSVLVRGMVEVWRDGCCLGRFRAPCGLTIPAGEKHAFVALEPDTAILCVHDIGAAEAVSVAAEHQLTGA